MNARLAFAAVLALAAAASAQTVPPALMVAEDGKSRPLRVAKVDADVRIVGAVAQTRMTLTFANPNDRVLAGDLYFPLPEGATVSGYALDINGKMVDGVAVEKQRAREVFEKIVRQGVDPGLVEWTKGNNFKTRVFPIPARGTRTVRVDYLTEIAGGAYRLPLNFKDKLEQLHVRVDIAGPATAAKVKPGALADVLFKTWQGSQVAEATLTDALADKDLVIDLPDRTAQLLAAEKAPDGAVYFAVHDTPVPDEAVKALRAPSHVVIYWDASASRAGADVNRQIGLLQACLNKWLPTDRKSAGFRVDLVVFRDRPEPVRQFTWDNLNWTGPNGNDALTAALKALVYDGGTQIGAISPAPGAKAPDMILLFTDGISTIGREQPEGFGKAPVYAISASPSANHAFLRYLADTTGGRYFNLARVKDAEVVAALGVAAYCLLSAGGEGVDLASTAPRAPSPIVGGNLMFVGKLTGPEGKLTLRYGRAGGPVVQRELTISAAKAPEGTTLQRFSAQKKLEDLLVLQDRHRDEILALGREHGLVTPFTSLIVLDSLEQYVEHKIAPPRSLPDMRQEYMRRIDTVAAQKKRADADKITAVLAQWNQRVEWWKKDFKYPKGFKYAEAKQDKGERALDAPRARMSIAGREAGGGQGVAGGPRPPAVDAVAEADGSGAAPPVGLLQRPDGPVAAAGYYGASRDDATVDVPRDGKYHGKDRSGQPGIAIKQWDPKTPYLEKLKAAKAEAAYETYLSQRAAFKASPAFFLDCADFFFRSGQDELAVRVLSNVAEMELENPALLRVAAHRLALAGEWDLAAAVFEEVLKLRPEEPQSYRDLALVLAERADWGRASAGRKKMTVEGRKQLDARLRADYGRAIELLNKVVMGTWDSRFAEIELTALIELNRLIPRAKEAGLKEFPVDPRLVQAMDLDTRIVMSWDADSTDIDLHVKEPSGEVAFYSHNRTTIGGLVSRDFTQGYGPEEYLLKKAMTGSYTIEANFYGSGSASLMGPVTVRVDVYTNFARPNETRKSMTLRLADRKETVTVGQVEY